MVDVAQIAEISRNIFVATNQCECNNTVHFPSKSFDERLNVRQTQVLLLKLFPSNSHFLP